MLQPLLLLANEGTDAGRVIAAHALAKIAITQNPDIAFPGQRVRTSLVHCFHFCVDFCVYSSVPFSALIYGSKNIMLGQIVVK